MKKILFATVAALALIGCQKQSELNFSDIKTSATVKGKVTYEVGYKVDGSQYIYEMLPAADVEVVAKIKYSEYSDGAQGVKQIVAKTDAEGNYELAIPVGQKAINVEVEPRGFEGEYLGNLNESGSVLPTKAYFKASAQNASVLAGEVKVLNNFEMRKDVADPIVTRNMQVKVAGKVKVQAEEATLDTKDEINGAKVGSAAANCKVKITFENINSSDKIIYNDVVVKEGEYSLTADIFDVWLLDETIVKVEALPYTTAEFVHYYYVIDDSAWKKQMLEGLYEKADNGGEVLGASAALVTFNPQTLTMKFTPTNKSVIRGIGNPDVDKDKDGKFIYGGTGANPFGFTY